MLIAIEALIQLFEILLIVLLGWVEYLLALPRFIIAQDAAVGRIPITVVLDTEKSLSRFLLLGNLIHLMKSKKIEL